MVEPLEGAKRLRAHAASGKPHPQFIRISMVVIKKIPRSWGNSNGTPMCVSWCNLTSLATPLCLRKQISPRMWLTKCFIKHNPISQHHSSISILKYLAVFLKEKITLGCTRSSLPPPNKITSNTHGLKNNK